MHGYGYGARYRVPKGWPAWKKRCRWLRKNGSQCRAWSCVGTDRCRAHGSGGIFLEAGWRRYLVGVISGADPTLIDPTITPNAVADELAIWVIRDEPRVSTTVKLAAACYLWDVLGRVDHQQDVRTLLMPHLGEEATTRAMQILRLHHVV